MSSRTYYDVLGIAQGASKAEIKKAYRKLAMKHHPDRNPGNKKSEEIFKQATEAYDVLSSDAKKLSYDASLRNQIRTGSPVFDDFINRFARPQNTAHRPKSHVYSSKTIIMNISMEQAFYGANISVSLVRQDFSSIPSKHESVNFPVSVPPKIRPGFSVRFNGEGDIMPDGRKSELVIRFDYPMSNGIYRLDRMLNLYMSMKVPWQYALEDRLIRHNLFGGAEHLDIKLHHENQSGFVYVFPNMGMTGRSNALVEVFYDLPRKIEDEDRKKIVEVLRKYEPPSS